MTAEQQLEAKTHLGRTVRFWGVDKGTVVDEVSVMANERKQVMQRIDHGGKFYIRTGYWKLNGSRIRWVRASLFQAEEKFAGLLAEARTKGWKIF